MRCQTKFVKRVIDEKTATEMYNFLRWNIEWEDGVKSKKTGFTRKAKGLNVGDIPEVDEMIINSLSKLTDIGYVVQGIYLNLYENGEHHTPSHSHKGTHQLVVSLGETRTLKVGTKNYIMEHGDAIIFGGSSHGVPKDNSVNGRISIATFMIPESEFLKQFELLTI